MLVKDIRKMLKGVDGNTSVNFGIREELSDHRKVSQRILKRKPGDIKKVKLVSLWFEKKVIK